MSGGRPSDYDPEVTIRICVRLVEGESLRKICRDEDMPAISTVFKWLAAHEEFVEQYARARDAQADTYADEIIDIADDGTRDSYKDADGVEHVDHDHIARARLRVDSRKWIASKLKAKKYGDRAQVELTGKDGGPIETKNADVLTDEQLAAIASRGRAAPPEPKASSD